MKGDFVAEFVCPVLDQGRNTYAHVLALKQRRRHLVNNPIGGPDAIASALHLHGRARLAIVHVGDHEVPP
jgi:hypothetical protein